jgi:hypothetical protein
LADFLCNLQVSKTAPVEPAETIGSANVGWQSKEKFIAILFSKARVLQKNCLKCCYMDFSYLTKTEQSALKMIKIYANIS